MKNNKSILKIVGIFLAGILLGWVFFGGNDESEESSDHQHAEAEEGEIWTCAMHPQIRQEEPGDCPVCGMELIPLNAKESSADPDIYQMSESAIKLANITTMRIDESQASGEMRLNGKVVVDERNEHSQSSHIPGRIEDLRVNFTGEKVNRGQTLAIIYSPDLVTAQEELLQAYQIRENQPEVFEAAKEKLRNWKIGEHQIDQILNNQEPLERFPIIADVSGVVTEKLVDLGDYVERGMPIYKIADLSKVWILFDLYESQIGWVQEGSIVEYSISSLPGETFEGTINFIDPLINSQTRVATARVEVDNKDGKLKPEMFATGIVENDIGETGSSEIVIPESAVLWTGKRSLVYLKEDLQSGTGFKLRGITLGTSLGDAYVVEEGLEVGDEIVVNGAFTVDAAVQLAGKPSMMNPSGEISDAGDQTSMNRTSNETERIEISNESQAKLWEIINSYMALKNALVDDNFESAYEQLIVFKKNLEEIEVSGLEETSADAFQNYNRELQRVLEILISAEDISAIREGFDEVSSVMISLAGTSPVMEKMYIQHCPMADNNKGADWLSFSEDIRNPYSGNSMLTCGEVTGVIEK